MEIKSDGNVIATVKDGEIVFKGTDLNPMLDERLESLEPREDEDGVIYYDKIKPNLLAKLAYLESVGFTVVE